MSRLDSILASRAFNFFGVSVGYLGFGFVSYIFLAVAFMFVCGVPSWVTALRDLERLEKQYGISVTYKGVPRYKVRRYVPLLVREFSHYTAVEVVLVESNSSLGNGHSIVYGSVFLSSGSQDSVKRIHLACNRNVAVRNRGSGRLGVK